MTDSSVSFVPQRAKEYYKTTGYRKRVIHQGSSDISYRKTANLFNDWVRQQEGICIKPSSLQYETKAEAKRVELAQNQATQCILAANSFDVSGNPQDSEQYVDLVHKENKEAEQAFKEVVEEAPEHIKPMLEFDTSSYEDKDTATYIAIDDVCNKEQKSSRQKEEIVQKPKEKSRSNGKKKYKKRKYLFHTVAKVITQKGSYTLTASKIGLLWSTLIAVLLRNNLLKNRLLFLVDGQRTLHDFIVGRMKWCGITLLLDWYHLRKKIHMQFSKALYKSDERDDLMLGIEQLLWYGLIDQAIKTLKQTSKTLIKNEEELEILIGYFERNRALIPNYACRQKLNMICSSNQVEKANDLIVSARQKRNGMSWTREGSNALATIATIQQNKELDNWLNEGFISFKLAA